MIITYPLMTVTDDSGAIVAGATVTVASVLDKAGSAISSPGATVNQSGANLSVDYDAEAHNEAWITLAISKVGSTFTGLNAAPAFYLAKDSGRIVGTILAAGANLNLAQPLAAPRVLDALADAVLTINDALHCAISENSGGESVAGTAYTKKTIAGTTIRNLVLDSATTPTGRS
jgi:hypothetical protein